MGYRHDRQRILDDAVAEALEHGLSQLSFGTVARRAGTSDRVVVYYFPTKPDLLVAVLATVGAQLQTTLAAAFTEPADNHTQLLRAAWPVLSTSASEPVFALFFEAAGLAAAGREPFATIVPELVEAWINWTEANLAGPKRHRRAEAEAAIATLDGLLLLRAMAGSDAANRAAAQMGL